MYSNNKLLVLYIFVIKIISCIFLLESYIFLLHVFYKWNESGFVHGVVF